MTVEERFDEPRDQLEFPVGMRVLAVDDDPTCLLLLETLLRRCQYHVTTTNQARKALGLLRENKGKFDLVISDVHMPDMDGFKLLELVGLEMDLPVIMLSGNDDPRLVMKGITHGACDYLLKPIRLEELKNIWQHVIRKKKKPPTSQKAVNKPQNGSSEGGHGSIGTLNKKRKDQLEDDYDENDENAQDNEDSSTQKKPRVVWSVELHQKFVAAVQQLGIDKAVPKRILELMKVENLSRENVASHLQKYRLYLRKYSHVASQQANMAAAYGNSLDSNYLRMLSLNGIGSYNTLSGSHVQNGNFNSFPQKAVFGRLNTPAGLGVRGLSSSGMGQVQLSHTPNPTFPNANMDKFQMPALLQGNQNENIFPGMPLSIDFDQMKGFTSATTPMGFPASNGLTDIKSTTGGLENTTVGASNDPLMTFLGSDLTSQAPMHVRGSGDWPNAVQSSGQHFINNSSRQDLSSNGFRENTPSQVHQLIGTQAVPHVTGSMTHKIDYTPKQVWNNPPVQNFLDRPIACGSVNSINFGNTSSLDQNVDPKMTSFHSNVGFNMTGQPNFDYSVHMLHNGIGNSALDITVRANHGQGQTQGGQSYNTFGSLDDLVSAVMKKEQKNMAKMEDEFGTDDFTSPGTCWSG